MDILDIRNLQLSYQAVYDETLCESMEDMGIIGEARDGYGDDSKFKQDTDADSFRPGKDVPKVKKFGRISRAMPPQISGHATKTISANTRTRGEDSGAPRSQKMFKSKKMVKRDGKWVKEELKAWVDALISEGYDLSEYTWDDMYEIYESYIVENQHLDEEITPARRRRYKAGLKVRQENQEASPGKARPRKRPTASRQHPSMRIGMTQDIRDIRRDNEREEHPYRPEGPGGITKNPRKLAQQKARGQHAEQVDLYDIILSHLLDEGYANDIESAEAIMVNMSEAWVASIIEG